MSKNQVVQTTSAGFPTLSILTIIFVIAKIAGYIKWSWWLVFAPLWVPTSLILGFFAVVLVVALAAAVWG